MSGSDDQRRDDMCLALRLMMTDLGEPYEWQEHDAKTAWRPQVQDQRGFAKGLDILDSLSARVARHGRSIREHGREP